MELERLRGAAKDQVVPWLVSQRHGLGRMGVESGWADQA